MDSEPAPVAAQEDQGRGLPWFTCSPAGYLQGSVCCAPPEVPVGGVAGPVGLRHSGVWVLWVEHTPFPSPCSSFSRDVGVTPPSISSVRIAAQNLPAPLPSPGRDQRLTARRTRVLSTSRSWLVSAHLLLRLRCACRRASPPPCVPRASPSMRPRRACSVRPPPCIPLHASSLWRRLSEVPSELLLSSAHPSLAEVVA